jgi:hypothetical protein
LEFGIDRKATVNYRKHISIVDSAHNHCNGNQIHRIVDDLGGGGVIYGHCSQKWELFALKLDTQLEDAVEYNVSREICIKSFEILNVFVGFHIRQNDMHLHSSTKDDYKLYLERMKCMMIMYKL